MPGIGAFPACFERHLVSADKPWRMLAISSRRTADSKFDITAGLDLPVTLHRQINSVGAILSKTDLRPVSMPVSKSR